jgi:hypothetical protein
VSSRSESPLSGLSFGRIGLGLAVTLVAIASASVLIGVDIQNPPEQRGIGVDVVGTKATKARGYDRGLTLAMAVKVDACDKPVRVRLTLAPTAEFWIDNHEALASDAFVRFAIPDELGADVPVEDAVDGLEAWMGTDGLAPFETAVPTARADVGLDPTAVKKAKATFITVHVPHWGSTLNPLTVQFSADWTRRRSFLGGCYVSLPAVAGLPTVLGTAQLLGKARPLQADLQSHHVNLVVVSSEDADLHAYYRPKYEVTRGVTSLELGTHTLVEGASIPAPNANLGGAPAWTCRSTTSENVEYRNLEPGDPARDVYALLEPDATFAISDQRLAQILRQSNCASFVAIESAGAGTRRDLVLLVVGAILALGIELFLSGLKRHRPEASTTPRAAHP